MEVMLDLERKLQDFRDDAGSLVRAHIRARNHHLGFEFIRDDVTGALRLFVSKVGKRELVRSSGEDLRAVANALAVTDQNQFTHRCSLRFEILAHLDEWL